MNGFPWTIKGFEMFVSKLSRGVAKLVKAPDFDSGMRGFESFLPCHFFVASPWSFRLSSLKTQTLRALLIQSTDRF